VTGLLGWKFGRLEPQEAARPSPAPKIELSSPAAAQVQQQKPKEGKSVAEGQILYKGKVLRDPKAFMVGALSGQRVLRFATAEALDSFLKKSAGRFPVMDRLDALLALRVRVDDPAGLDEMLDGSVENGFIFPVIPPNPRGGEVQSNAAPLGDGLLAWLGVQKVDASWGAGVKVALLDTGVAPHSTFASEIKNVMIVESAVGPEGWNGHGTAVASLIAGKLRGVQGVAPGADLTSFRISDDKGSSDTWSMAAAIRRAADDETQVISISMGSYGDSPLVQDAVDYALGKGSVIVAASGNDSYEKPTYPAAYPGVVKAVAVDALGEHLLFSNAADESGIAAPGWAVNAAYPDETVVEFSGTSASAPIISGAVAAVMTKAGKDGARLSAREALDLMFAYANEAGAAGVGLNGFHFYAGEIF
jgi:subtilisin family serine protease